MAHEIFSVTFRATGVNYVCSEFLAKSMFTHWVPPLIFSKHRPGSYCVILLDGPVCYREKKIFRFRCAFSFEVPFEQLNGFWTKECAEFYSCFVAAFTG